MRRLAILTLAVGTAMTMVACSGANNNPDAGTAQTTLEILDPPGDSIGLAQGASAELRVRFRGTDGETTSGVAVGFELVAGPSEEVGGATLSASVANTESGDASGIATISVTAGSSDANFRVRATAEGATPAVFFVVVSNSGFATIAIETTHIGARAPADYTNLEFRLFDPSTLICADLDIDALPDSILPPRQTAGFGERALYTNLGAVRPYTVVVWGEHDLGGVRLGLGCIELTSEQVTPGPGLQLTAPVADRALSWPAPVEVTSVIALANLLETLDGFLAGDLWNVVACDLGVAQLAIDCALDAAVSDGTLDCNVTGAGALIDDVNALRGPVDAAGCRPDELSPGVASLDRDLLDGMNAGPWTELEAVALGAAREQLLSGFRLVSTISVDGESIATHALDRLQLIAGGLTHEETLSDSARPVVTTSVAASADESGTLQIESHGFTLDLDLALSNAFDALLEEAGLGSRGADLGAALAESFGGCTAFSTALCQRVSRPDECVLAACTTAATELDSRLRDWLGAVSTGGLDFALVGDSLIEDRDFDLTVDTIGGGPSNQSGSWTVELNTTAGSIDGAGVFGSN